MAVRAKALRDRTARRGADCALIISIVRQGFAMANGGEITTEKEKVLTSLVTALVMKALPLLLRISSIAASILILAGCSSVGDVDENSLPYKPKAGKGLVIIYREGTSLFREGWVGRILNFRHVYDGDRDFGKLSEGTFILDNALPGTHVFYSGKDDERKTTLVVEPGKTYFLRAQLHNGMWTPGESLDLVDFSEGVEGLEGLELAEPEP
jgi:hypothetical protein